MMTIGFSTCAPRFLLAWGWYLHAYVLAGTDGVLQSADGLSTRHQVLAQVSRGRGLPDHDRERAEKRAWRQRRAGGLRRWSEGNQSLHADGRSANRVPQGARRPGAARHHQWPLRRISAQWRRGIHFGLAAARDAEVQVAVVRTGTGAGSRLTAPAET